MNATRSSGLAEDTNIMNIVISYYTILCICHVHVSHVLISRLSFAVASIIRKIHVISWSVSVDTCDVFNDYIPNGILEMTTTWLPGRLP